MRQERITQARGELKETGTIYAKQTKTELLLSR